MSRKLECTLIYQMGIQIYDQISIMRNWSEVKLHRAFSLDLGSKESRQLRPLQNLACMFLYQTSIQIYDQISTPRIWSKVKLHHSILLRFGLKEGKMVEKLETNATFQALVSPSLPKVQNSSDHCKSWCACFYIKRASKSMIKLKLREFGQK